jgi:hypothetical protein
MNLLMDYIIMSPVDYKQGRFNKGRSIDTRLIKGKTAPKATLKAAALRAAAPEEEEEEKK